MNDSLKSRLFVFGQFALLALLIVWPEDRKGFGSLDVLFELVAFLAFVGGVVLVIAAIRQLFTFSIPKLTGTTKEKNLKALRIVMPKPMDDAKLVTTGIFRTVRHPIYSGLIMIGYGIGIGNGPVPQLFFAIGLHAVLRYKSELEEKFLSEKFAEYSDYIARTNRFFPKADD